MLRTSEVAQLLGVRANTVRHSSDKGILKAYRIGPRCDRRFRREDVDALLKESLLKGRELSHVGQPAGNGTWLYALPEISPSRVVCRRNRGPGCPTIIGE